MTYNLFIDDERFPPADNKRWQIVRGAPEAIQYMLHNGCPNYISFDHDLGETNAMQVVHWMVEHDLDMNGMFIPNNFSFYVHSQNPIGVQNIKGMLNSYLSHKIS